MGSQSERSCAVCRTRLPKSELTRWVVADDVAQADQSAGQPGRGYYSCADCTDKAASVISAKASNRRKHHG